MAVLVTLAAIAAPTMVNTIDSLRLGMAMRDVERELQFARLTSVATNRPMRVRFDCPTPGSMRVVELLGTVNVPSREDYDDRSVRCSEGAYPYLSDGGDQNRLTKPNNDGPVRRLQPNVSFTAKRTLEFWPDGSVHAGGVTQAPWWPLDAAGATITLTRKGISKSIRINARGRIQMDR